MRLNGAGNLDITETFSGGRGKSDENLALLADFGFCSILRGGVGAFACGQRENSAAERKIPSRNRNCQLGQFPGNGPETARKAAETDCRNTAGRSR